MVCFLKRGLQKALEITRIYIMGFITVGTPCTGTELW